MTTKYIFDVDGTLTPSRQRIDPEFGKWFAEFCMNYDVYLVTGSDNAKTIEQLGEYLCRWPIFIYNCSGNDVWAKGERLRGSEWTLPTHVQEFLQYRLQSSKFVLRTGLHFDVRPGSVNFSIVGRGATLKERMLYREWDLSTNERKQIVNDFKRNFGHELEATIGGETGIDIYPIGRNKSQILADFGADDYLHFFGDAMGPNGNDLPLADAIVERGNGWVYPVQDWQETWKILKTLVDK
jgi:phosphomannomutase